MLFLFFSEYISHYSSESTDEPWRLPTEKTWVIYRLGSLTEIPYTKNKLQSYKSKLIENSSEMNVSSIYCVPQRDGRRSERTEIATWGHVGLWPRDKDICTDISLPPFLLAEAEAEIRLKGLPTLRCKVCFHVIQALGFHVICILEYRKKIQIYIMR